MQPHTHPHKHSKTACLEAFGVKHEVGLTREGVAKSREKYGANTFTKGKKESFFRRLWAALTEPMLVMLLAAGFVALSVAIVMTATGGHADYFESAGVFFAIILSVAISMIMEGRSQKAFEALSKINDDTVIRVIRNGEPTLIPLKDVVVGDIVFLETGDKIPADGRLLEATALSVDESALTGESMPSEKNADEIFRDDTPVAERLNMCYSGCFVTGGSGKMLVTQVGDETEFGKIAKELAKTENAVTPLQQKLAKLGKTVAILGTACAVVVFLVQLFKFLIIGQATLENLSEAFISSIVLIVAAVPEGLPTMVALSLSINIVKMSKQNALVKKMVACETIGCVNVICSDKTGTLTENKMTVTDVYLGGKICKPEELKNVRLLNNFCVNASADIKLREKNVDFIGNPTECALLYAASKAGVSYKSVRAAVRFEQVYAFSSETKNMTTIIKEGNAYTVFTKGSPERILDMCSMSVDERKKVQDAIAAFQKKACRVIAFASREITRLDMTREQVERNMTFDGFAAIQDPLRKEVFSAVSSCRSAGIDVKMLTGDNILTATAIATELGIYEEGFIATEAKYLEELSDERLIEMLPKIRVIARSTPIIKMRVVNLLKKTGNVVAVTGDGINDAPAIKNADVGVAMGIAGTEVSKEASDIVLLDDSFSTIVKAVHWGRGIYQNFQRFIQFQLTVNLAAVVVVLLSVWLGFKPPFTALQLLWINLIMDGPPALTLGVEPIRDGLMKNKPTKRGENIITKPMMYRILMSGILMSVLFMLQQGLNFLRIPTGQESTALFTVFVLFQLFNAFNCREQDNASLFANFFKNKLSLIAFGITLALQIIITQFGGSFFKTVPLSAVSWLKITALALTVIVLSETVKLIGRAKEVKNSGVSE